jgi:hypothetical protein
MNNIKTIKAVKQQKIDTASNANIMLAAKTWKPTTRRGRVSVLQQHLDTVRYLRSARRLSYKNITDFFNANGVKVSYPNVVAFAKKNKIGGSGKKTKKSEE